MDAAETLGRLLLGASERVLLKAHWSRGEEFGVDLGDIAAIVDHRLERRCLLPVVPLGWRGISSERPDHRLLAEVVEAFQKEEWDVRLIVEPAMPVSSLVVDHDSVIYYEYLNDHPGPFLRESPRDVEHYSSQFETHWARSQPAESVSELYLEDQLVMPSAAAAIARASEDSWGNLISLLACHPEGLRDLTPRRFEELVAELLSREGAEVILTPRSSDGGRDVLAFFQTPVGRHLYLVECKRYSPDNPVGVALVRALYGVVTSDRATAGLLVTTSRFTKGALQYAESLSHQLALREYRGVCEWLRRHANR